jgi:heptosyltransferase-1
LDSLTRETGLRTVILGGPGDEAALGRIRGMADSDPLSLVGKTSLTQAAGAIERAALVIGVDTGLTHMGIAFDRPTIAIFGSNIPYTEPPTDRARVLVHWLECSPCKGNPTCNGDYTCLKLIGVEEVLAAAREVMANGKRERSRQEAKRDPGRPTDVDRAAGADGASAGPAHGAEERKGQEGP